MDTGSLPALLRAQALRTEQALLKSNALTERYGLSLTDSQIVTLVEARMTTLSETGRVELGEGILPRLIYAFCDSPYIDRTTYCSTLIALQSLFYTLKNEAGEALSDDELIAALERLFNGKAQGSLEYLENATLPELYRAAFGTPETDESEEAADDWMD